MFKFYLNDRFSSQQTVQTSTRNIGESQYSFEYLYIEMKDKFAVIIYTGNSKIK